MIRLKQMDSRIAAFLCLLLAFACKELAAPYLIPPLVIPAGTVAAWLLGSTPFSTPEGVAFGHAGTIFEVTAACSGILFMGLLVGMAFLSTFSLKRILFALPLIYLYVVSANVLRIVFWATIFPLINDHLPESFADAAHEIAGALVYLPAVILARLAYQRFLANQPSGEEGGTTTNPTANATQPPASTL
tara:strand:+ start:34753 stop:35319 length:567 start_codon:yes stop_codon:yes gene_type:complete